MVHFSLKIVDRVVYQRAFNFFQTEIAPNRGLKISTFGVGTQEIILLWALIWEKAFLSFNLFFKFFLLIYIRIFDILQIENCFLEIILWRHLRIKLLLFHTGTYRRWLCFNSWSLRI